MGISNITSKNHHANLSSANSTMEDQLEEVEQNNNNNQHQLLNHFLYGSPNGDQTNSHGSSNSLDHHQQRSVKKKRNLPGTPDPNAEVIALSPTTLMARNRFVCEICNKGFQRDQNLQLHRRGHNLPWKLRQRTGAEVKKRVYVCPEPTCVHHNPARALGDLTGIKKHFSRKHGEKKWKCEKCSKKYAVQSDLKAHQKTCGTREYKCDCGTLFSRRDSFITHRAFCNALTEESNKLKQGILSSNNNNNNIEPISIISTPKLPHFGTSIMPEFNPYDQKTPFKSLPQELNNSTPTTGAPGGLFMGGHYRNNNNSSSLSSLKLSSTTSSRFSCLYDSKNGCLQDTESGTATLVTSATALLQKAAQIGATTSSVGVLKSPLMEMPHSDHQPDMVGMNMGMYGHMMMMKEQDHNCSTNSSSFVGPEKGQWRPISRFSGGGSGSGEENQMMTLDLLGERGWRLRHLQGDESSHHYHQQEMVPIMKHFEMQSFHGDSSNVDKSIFEF